MITDDTDRKPPEVEPDLCDSVRVLSNVVSNANDFFEQNNELIKKSFVTSKVKEEKIGLDELKRCLRAHLQKSDELHSMFVNYIKSNFSTIRRVLVHSLPPHRLCVSMESSCCELKFPISSVSFSIDGMYEYYLAENGEYEFTPLPNNSDVTTQFEKSFFTVKHSGSCSRSIEQFIFDIERKCYCETEVLSDCNKEDASNLYLYLIKLVDARIGFVSDRIYTLARVIMKYSNEFKLGCIPSDPITSPKDDEIETTDADTHPPVNEVHELLRDRMKF